jgi:hypothetical protein
VSPVAQTLISPWLRLQDDLINKRQHQHQHHHEHLESSIASLITRHLLSVANPSLDQMSQILAAALAAKFPDELPPWTVPFLQAARRMDILEKREADGTNVTAENKPQPPPAKKQKKGKTAKKGKSKNTKKGKGKAKVPDDAAEDEVEDGLGDDVEDEVMAAAAEELLIEVSAYTPG